MKIKKPKLKFVTLGITILLVLGVLGACNNGNSSSSDNTNKQTTSTDTTSKGNSTSTDSNSNKDTTNNGNGKGATKTTLFVDFASGKSFDSTVSALKESVSKNGMMVLGNFNQAKGLNKNGLQLKGAHSFFIGNPTMSK